MKFCSDCGSLIEKRVPEGDNLERDCCTECDAIFYSNPRVIVGTVPIKDNGVLLCKRAIQPRQGLWTLPAGFLENGETIEEGAFRETKEETNTEVKMGNLYAIFNIPQINQVYMLHLAEVINEDYNSTTESLEVEIFAEKDIPWDKLAFPFVPTTLKKYFKDAKRGKFPLSTQIIERPPRKVN